MEAVAEQNRVEVAVPLPGRIVSEEARKKLEAYVRAWKLPESMGREVIAATLACAEERFAGDKGTDETRALIEESETILRGRLNDLLGHALGNGPGGISVQERAALLWAGSPELLTDDRDKHSKLASAYSEGVLATTLTQHPQRPPETQPMTMETSLTRLPSFRIIAGWALVITLIVLAFIFTR